MSKYKNITMDLGFGSMMIEFNPPVDVIPTINCNIKLELYNGKIVFRGLNINSDTIDLTQPTETRLDTTIMPSLCNNKSVQLNELDRKALKQSWLGVWLTDKNYRIKLIELIDDVYFSGLIIEENTLNQLSVHYNTSGNPYNFQTEKYGKLMRRLDTEASYAETVTQST